MSVNPKSGTPANTSSASTPAGTKPAARAARRPAIVYPTSSLLPLELWMPGVELLRDVPDGLASWLTENGTLTARIRATSRDGRCRLRVLDQRVGFLTKEQQAVLDTAVASCFVREIELVAGEEPWVFAQTLVPDTTLELHPWLAELGDSPLGETLAEVGGLERGPFEYATLPAAHPLAARALEYADEEPDFLWARRSWFAIRGRRLLVQEVFLPALRDASDA